MPVYKVNGEKKDGLQKYRVRVNYISDNGKQQQLTRIAYGKETADDLERRLNDDIKRKGENTVKKVTVQQFFDNYIKVKCFDVRETTLEKSRQNFKYYILPKLGSVRIDKLSPTLLQEWKLSLEQRDLAVNTKKQAYSDFRTMLSYAVTMEYLRKNPLSSIGNFRDVSAVPKEEMSIYMAQEFQRFICEAEKCAEERQVQKHDLWEWDFYVFFNIAFYTGLRKGEIYALKWSDIDNKYLSVKRSITQKLRGGDRETPPKNKSSVRTLQMPLPLIKVLDEHRARQETLPRFSDDYRICGGERSVRDTTVRNRNTLYAKRSELKTIRIHDFRHSHVSLLANAGVNIQEVARRLGHSRIEMTLNTYAHLYPREEERAVGVLNNI